MAERYLLLVKLGTISVSILLHHRNEQVEK